MSDHEDTMDSSCIKEWGVQTRKGDYQVMAKMLRENPKLSGHINCPDFSSGYTGLHWACKHGNLDMVKLVATYQASVNVRSNTIIRRFLTY